MMPLRTLLPIGLLLSVAQVAAQVTVVKDPPKASVACKPWDNDADCVIRLKIDPPVDGSNTCTVDLLDAQQKVVGVKRGTRVVLVWMIDKAPTGYGFDHNDGIDFVNDPSPRQFAWPSRRDQGADLSTYFWWTDKNNRLRANYYEYEVNVRSQDGSVRCYVPDRWIKNQ